MELRTPLMLALTMLALTLTAPPTHAYNWQQCDGENRTWDSDDVTFRPMSASFPWGSDWRDSINAIDNAWNSAPGTKFDFFYNYSNMTISTTFDGVNSILISSDYDWGDGVLAVALRRYEICIPAIFDGSIAEADVFFNADYTWNNETNPTPGSMGINSTLVGLHELGHAMGLDHSDSLIATMNSSYPQGGPIGDDNDVVPHGDDVSGDRAGYGTSGSPRDVYASTFARIGSGQSRRIVAPANAYRGHPTFFQFTLGNRGTAHESSVEVRFYLSTDRNITTNDHWVGSAGFAVGEGKTLTPWAQIRVPSSVPQGSYYLGWIVDPDDSISEDDEGNNSVAMVDQTQLY